MRSNDAFILEQRIFSLPNQSIEDDVRPIQSQKVRPFQPIMFRLFTEPYHQQPITQGVINLTASTFENSVKSPADSSTCGLDIVSSSTGIRNPSTDTSQGVQRMFSLILRIVLFIPWCVSVGGCILLSPSSLDLVAFKTGILASLQGIHRFAHWADVAVQHVAIFLAFIFALGWWNKAFGLAVALAVFAGVVNAWWDFKVDLAIPLGECDRQSLGLLLWGKGIDEEGICVRGSKGEKVVVRFHDGEKKTDA
jgi:hypothetical protein